jgi:DNA-directed RNA polymerase specialized sigma24 family protein
MEHWLWRVPNMARDLFIEGRLQRWAVAVTVGDGSGYPVMSVLHEEWQPPSPGVTPTMKVGVHSDVRETHAALRVLSQRLQNTVVAHYCMKLPIADQALLLECAGSTIHARIDLVHRLLPGILADIKAVEFCK